MRSLIALVLLLTSSCGLLTPNPAPPVPWTTASGIVVLDLLEPEGDPVVVGQDISVHYKASLGTGVEFDTSYDHGAPIEFTAGAGQVPPGFDEGVLGMTLGAQRQIIVPPALAYGEAGIPGLVPPGAAITFHLEIMEVGPAPPAVPALEVALEVTPHVDSNP